MPLREDLTNKVNSYFVEPYFTEETSLIPSTDYSKLTFGNKGLISELCFLFIDIRKSSKLHETYGYKTAAIIYQSFHHINVRIITSLDGVVRAFDGDRIMGVFSGSLKCTNAVKSGMKVRWAIDNILNKKLSAGIKIGVGVDYGKTLITKVGKGRDINNQDLIWVGPACNYASHYCQEASQSIIISERTYNKMHKGCKLNNEGGNMWNYKYIKLKNDAQIKCCETTYRWGI